MKSLKELMDEALIEFNIGKDVTSIDKFIKDDEKSAEFIRLVLHDPDYSLPDPQSDLYKFVKGRARHSVITFLTGLVFKEFGDLFSSLDQILLHGNTENAAEDISSKLWLITSLYHDRAYHSEYLKKGHLDYGKNFKYNLLTDEYSEEALSILNFFSKKYDGVLAHTYDQILQYDIYAREYHLERSRQDKTEIEMLDHGILGGMMVFNDLVRKYLKKPLYNIELLIIKTCCLTIAQHNIYMSNSAERDKKYGETLAYLYHDSSFRISAHTPLLLLMSLVDTLECVKKFSRGNNKESSLETLTVLSNIRVYVDETEIVLDCSELHKRTKRSEELEHRYNEYVKAVRGLGQWTAFDVENNSGSDIFYISLQDNGTHGDKNLVGTAIMQ